MDSQSEIMSHPSDGCSMSSNITRCTNVKVIIIIITIIISSSFTLARSASQRSLLSPLRPHTIFLCIQSYTIPHNPTQSHTNPHKPINSYSIPHNPTNSQTFLHNPTNSYTIPHNPTNSHTILHNPTQYYTIQHNPIQSHTIPHNPTQSHTIPYNPIQSHTIPYNPTQSYTIPHNPRSSQGGRFLREGDPSTGSRRPAQKRTDRRVLSILETLSFIFSFVFKPFLSTTIFSSQAKSS